MEQGLAQSSLDIRGLYLMLRRHVRLLGLGAVLGVILALALLVVNRPQYTATTALMVDSREEKILNDAIVAPFRPPPTPSPARPQSSWRRTSLKRVVDKLDARQGPGFRAPPPHRPGLLGTAKAQLFMLFGVRPREAQQRRWHER